MQNIDSNSLSSSDLDAISRIAEGNSTAFWRWLLAMQDDMESLPSVLSLVSGNFPETPNEGIGLIFLASGTYEVASAGNWRRLYDASIFASGTPAP